jgi:hypothetical protein
MTTTRNALLALAAGALVLLGTRPGDASPEPFALYEDWTTAATIRSDRWAAAGDFGQETEREVRGDALSMRFRRAGGTGSDAGAAGFFSNRLVFVNPLSVTQMEVDLKVTDVTVTGCPANGTASVARAATIDLNRISDLAPGTPSAPGDVTGDHIARVEVRRLSDSTDPDGVLTVRALLFRCNNGPCTSSTVDGSPVVLGQVATHKVFRIRLGWDPVNNEFRAGLNDDPDVSVPYPATANARPANAPFAALRIQHLPANCTVASGGPTVGDAEIEIRSVRTNASAVIP